MAVELQECDDVAIMTLNRQETLNALSFAIIDEIERALNRVAAMKVRAKDRIRVLDVAPGYIETDLNRDYLSNDKVKAWLQRRVPVGHAGSADEVARLIGSIFAENIAFLTGETIYLDGGQGMNH